MLNSMLALHVCPKCRSPELMLETTETTADGSVRSGSIRCASCASGFPVVAGLPRFVERSNYAQSFGFQWNRHARTQLDSHSGLQISRQRVLRALGAGIPLQGLEVLEAGSGAGRFTEVLLNEGARVVSFDYSDAVEANAANHAEHPGLHLFQGDIFKIPLREGCFGAVLCLGVIQHTPDPTAAFQSLARYVRPGGWLVVDSYARTSAALLQWKYLLRPITRRMAPERLYRIIERCTPMLMPAAKWLRRIGGRFGARLVPIVEYSHLGLPPELNVEWAILDTFDMYSPAHDHPQSLQGMQSWFEAAGFRDIDVRRGPNGVVGRGRRPVAPANATA
jgi:2-polyprenyl-3-methyl-5-hydroxy-6-metoxy-1,4-benzoquinol methylase